MSGWGGGEVTAVGRGNNDLKMRKVKKFVSRWARESVRGAPCDFSW